MKLLAMTSAAALFLTACASDPYQKRAEAARDRQERLVAKAISQAPKWMAELPQSENAVYASASSISPDLEMSLIKAKTMAFGKICMAAGGKVNQQTKIYRSDSENNSAEFSEVAIKSMCPTVDITGAEIREVKTVAEGERFRTYVLVALPTGDANALARARDNRNLQNFATRRSQEVFRDMDRQ